MMMVAYLALNFASSQNQTRHLARVAFLESLIGLKRSHLGTHSQLRNNPRLSTRNLAILERPKLYHRSARVSVNPQNWHDPDVLVALALVLFARLFQLPGPQQK